MPVRSITHRNVANHWEFDEQRFFNPTQVFGRSSRLLAVKNGALSVPESDRKGARRQIDDRSLGELIGFAEGNGIARISFERITVSVHYLQSMLRFKGKRGWFVDYLDNSSDHDFDPSTPTPGLRWSEGHELRRIASELEGYARLARVANQHEEAAKTEEEASSLRALALEMLYAVR